MNMFVYFMAIVCIQLVYTFCLPFLYGAWIIVYVYHGCYIPVEYIWYIAHILCTT